MDGMQLYNKVYADAIATNYEETERWRVYRKEHEDVKYHLQMYQNELKVDVLIPIGSKAFLPGQLYHTGEVMVSHGSGYFSDCSVEQAKHIADHRISIADKILLKYEQEKDLFTDRMEVPFAEDAFRGQEIIEEYNEEHEKLWTAQHKKRVKDHKRREAKERLQNDALSSGENILDRLEELELMEELEQELDNLDSPVETDEQLRKLMSGEMKLNEKGRVAHVSNDKSSEVDGSIQEEAQRAGVKKMDNEQYELEITDDGSSESDDSNEDVSPEFVRLLQDTKSMNKKNKIEAFKNKLNEIHTRLQHNETTVEEKVDLCDLRYEIEEALDFLHPSWETLENAPDSKKSAKKQKTIKFAATDSVRFIDDHETVATTDNLQKNGRTLELKIVHSPEHQESPWVSTDSDIQSPVDIYRLFEHCLKKEESITPTVETKSILKNREMVLAESHNVEAPILPKLTRQKPEIMPADIIGDVIEHNAYISSEENSKKSSTVQAKTGQQKVSRFKQQRC